MGVTDAGSKEQLRAMVRLKMRQEVDDGEVGKKIVVLGVVWVIPVDAEFTQDKR